MRQRISVLLILLMSLVFVVSGCGQTAEQGPAEQPEVKTLKLATTTSTEDSGLLDFILPEMEKDIGYEVDVIAVGTGQAIAMGEAGDVDVILVHSRAAEDKFVEEGFGVDRQDVMYNDFLLIGPEDDPAQIKDQNIVDGLAAIAEGKGVFVSRGDKSGTHNKEVKLFEDAGVAVDANLDWYVETGQGMGDTYRVADEMKAYTLIDRATYYANMDKYNLVSIIEGDAKMFNPYGVIPVNPDKYPNVDFEGATAFANWLTSEKGQAMIGEFGVDKFGEPLFFPDAK